MEYWRILYNLWGVWRTQKVGDSHIKIVYLRKDCKIFFSKLAYLRHAFLVPLFTQWQNSQWQPNWKKKNLGWTSQGFLNFRYGNKFQVVESFWMSTSVCLPSYLDLFLREVRDYFLSSCSQNDKANLSWVQLYAVCRGV